MGAACLAMHGTGWGQAAGSSVAASAAQSTAQSSDTTFRVISRETVVDDTVTDTKGRAIHGLKQYDFAVGADGSRKCSLEFDLAA